VGRDLQIELFEPAADVEELDRLIAALRVELLALDVDAVFHVSAGPAPAGSKGLELAEAGALLVQVRDSLPLINAVVSTVRAWLLRSRSSGRSLKVTVDGRTLELSAATADQQQRIVDEFVRSLGA
jgi:hypothetical protein